MKTNAPEKIWVHEASAPELTEKLPYHIEYTRTDAFVEKAVKWLKANITNNPNCDRVISRKGVVTMGILIEDFRKYMKGE